MNEGACSQVVRILLCVVLTFLLTISVEPEKTLQAQTKSRKQTKSRRKSASSKKKRQPPKPKYPTPKTPAEKLKLLQQLGQPSTTARRVARTISYSPVELDKSLETRIKFPKHRYTPLVGDEVFLRRAYLDLIGKLPASREINAFVSNSARKKRSVLINKLLESDDYSRKWAHFWQTIIFHNSNANKNRINPQALENWFAEQFRKNVPWDRITAELLSAKGTNKDHGPDNFLLACEGKPKQLAAETARIFMGINIQCAECHNHPFDQWKREQFHEMAAFFSRGKYYMTALEDPTKKTEMSPRFLLGEVPPDGLKADLRRVAVAAYLIYNQKNYWYARAFVNRIWNELVGDGFYSVDSLGPDGEVAHKMVVNRMGAVFRYKGFDPKWLFRLIMNSHTYQRDIRTITLEDELFTAVRPSRLRGAQVATAVDFVLTNKGVKPIVDRTFKVDPSQPQRDLEGSIQQALLMMNNPAINNSIKRGPLKKRLLAMKSDYNMVGELYRSVLARSPQQKEIDRSLIYIRKTGNRIEAVEDLIWVLLNSTEFITKR